MLVKIPILTPKCMYFLKHVSSLPLVIVHTEKKKKSDELKSQCKWFIVSQINITHWNFSLEHSVMENH